jgi:hypothetical protein
MLGERAVATERTLPADPLAFICRCVKQGKIFWTYHVNMRLEARHVARKAVLESVESFEIIESYPKDKYLPSYLVYAKHESETFHVLFATDVAGDSVRIVTAYHPDAGKWESDLKTRRLRR